MNCVEEVHVKVEPALRQTSESRILCIQALTIERRKKPTSWKKDRRGSRNSPWFLCIFSSFKNHKILQNTRNYEKREKSYLFFFTLGLCVQANDKIAHQITKTLMSFVAQPWSSTWCCFDVRNMMNDPLNSCLNPNKPTKILSAYFSRSWVFEWAGSLFRHFYCFLDDYNVVLIGDCDRFLLKIG